MCSPLICTEKASRCFSTSGNWRAGIGSPGDRERFLAALQSELDEESIGNLMAMLDQWEETSGS